MDRRDFSIFDLDLDGLGALGCLVHKPHLKAVGSRRGRQTQDGALERRVIGEHRSHFTARLNGTFDFPTQGEVGIGIEIDITGVGARGGRIEVSSAAARDGQ